MQGRNGFTLLELLVVLVLLTGITALVAPAFLKGGGVDVQAASRNLAAGLRRARSQAIQANAMTAVSVDVERREFALSFEDRPRRLPGDIELSLYTARSAVESESRGAIRFFPDGGSTGGRITLKRGPRRIHVDVDWLGGRVRILEDAVDGDRLASR
ncbi:MAG TPA: GspH/FimT family protein [Gammaproteobacteria bacterium]|nr:GspH/FimT family protein [Gammaproteobacteria bacterium]